MKRNKHNLSNYKLATMDMGKLYPVQVQEVLPGDTFRMESSALVRLSPMLAPVMHPVTVRLHHWFVPHRLVWDKWEDFITGTDDTLTPPTVTIDDVPETTNRITDYMSIPSAKTGESYEVNAMPIRAYNLIFNEFYRDQDLQTEVEDWSLIVRTVAWRKDYFTAARPWAQKGEDLVLPIGTSAPVNFTGQTSDWLTHDDTNTSNMYLDTNGNFVGDGAKDKGYYPMDGQFTADLSQATGVSATEFREFFAMQRYQEARARYGSRYSEYLRYLGVRPSDARLQRPEYIGGGKTTVQISEVLQTAYDSNSSVGTLRGHGITAVRSRGVKKFFEEHGTVITLMSVIPKSIYTDGVPRFFLKQTKEDFFQKELQSVGQQPVKKAEVYAPDTSDTHGVFGYQDRYSEYTWSASTVAGEFRNILDFWHLGRKFDSMPGLNETFIGCVPSKRIFAEQSKHSLWCMINNKVVARRMVKKVSVGRLM
jgi:hypothetical protein